MRFAAIGRTHWLFDSIKACVAGGHELAYIATAPAAPEYKVAEAGFQQLAAEYDCPFYCRGTLSDEDVKIAGQSNADVAISVNWPTLVNSRMLAQFKHGIVNAHAGDLPRFRGNAVPNWAILTGESAVVLSLHRMASELDAGDIFLQSRFPLSESTYVADVYRFLEAKIPEMYAVLLDQLEAGLVEPKPQPLDPALSLRCYPRTPTDGLLDWNRPAVELARQVRASSDPFAGAFTYLDGKRVTVWRAHARTIEFPHLGVPGQVISIDKARGYVHVLTADGSLVLEELEGNDSGRLPASKLVRSTRKRFGLDVTETLASLQARLELLEESIRSQSQSSQQTAAIQ